MKKLILLVSIFMLITAGVVFAGGEKEAAVDPQELEQKDYPIGEKTGLEPAPTKKDTPIKIGVTPTAMDTHYEIVFAGCKTAVRELGGPDVVNMVIQAPSSQATSINEQIPIVESWIQQNYDAICIATANDQAMTPIYRKAAEKGIPIFHFNTPLEANVNPYYVSSVNYSGEEAAYLAMKWMVDNYDDEPFNLVIMEGLPGVHNTERMRGINKALAESKNFTVLESQSGGWVRQKSQSVMEDILTKHGDKVDGVIGLYDEMSLGALAAIKNRNYDKEIIVVGYDNTPDANAEIKKGNMHATVDTGPKQRGYDMIMAVYDYVVKGKMVDKVINITPTVWSYENIDEYNMNDYIFVE